MPLNVDEATNIFRRRAEDLLEQAEGIRIGLNLVNMQQNRIRQLEGVLAANKIAIPGEGGPGLPAPGPDKSPSAAKPENVTPIKPEPQDPPADASGE